MRAIEEHLISRKAENLTVKCHRDVAAYVLNEKRDHLLDLEAVYGISIFIVPSDDVKGSQVQIERAGERAVPHAQDRCGAGQDRHRLRAQETKSRKPRRSRRAKPTTTSRGNLSVTGLTANSKAMATHRAGAGAGADDAAAGAARIASRAQAINDDEREEMPGLGDQPQLEPRDEVVESREDEAVAEGEPWRRA